MKLTDDEKAMLDGREGPARQKAMELLVRYGEALGAERFVDTNNVCGANVFTPRQWQLARLQTPSQGAIFSQLSLDSEEVLDIPLVKAYSCQLIGPMDRENWRLQGISEEEHSAVVESESYSAQHGIHLMSTCTPYQVGNVPVKGEHCAWMESSAVVYINSVLGARSNVEGRESAAAAMLTGKIPYWGYHLEENRFGTHLVNVEWDVDSVMDWGLLGYYVGQIVEDQVPVLNGVRHVPDLVKLKHFGAAAASSVGIEMYHIPGVTAEAASLEQAFGPRKPVAQLSFGAKERKKVYEDLNSTATDPQVDLVMIGCPHATIEQIWEVCRMLDGKRTHENCHLWVFTPDPIRRLAERNGYAKILRDAGAVLMSDTCPAIGRFLPKGTKVVATDSAKQVHYLPAIMGVQGWFGSLQECVEAAITGRWSGGL
ncbi:MAG: aconitase X catalytic domain-containing protein [Alicyclobacillus shizuokensis]|nr:aconitase X catalytic domain-containing protein [Alicyclobacillus shizuokensis]